MNKTQVPRNPVSFPATNSRPRSNLPREIKIVDTGARSTRLKGQLAT